MENLRSESIKYIMYTLVLVGFLIALTNNLDAFMHGVKLGLNDIFGK